MPTSIQQLLLLLVYSTIPILAFPNSFIRPTTSTALHAAKLASEPLKPIVLAGYSGAGRELPRLANALILELFADLTAAQRALLLEEDADVSNDVINCGVMEPVGRDEQGVYTYDEDIFTELITGGQLGGKDVILLDFSSDLFRVDGGALGGPLTVKYQALLQHLYQELGCTVIYVNVHPEYGMMAPDVANGQRLNYETLVKYSDYEIVLKDEGLSAGAILARDALGEVEGDKMVVREVGSFDALQNEMELSGDGTAVEEQVEAWKSVVWDLKRLVLQSRKTPDLNGKKKDLSLFGLDTFFTSLTFDDVRKSKKYLENLCKDSDALEFRADLISLDDVSGENVRSYDARHHLQHQLALLRRMSRDHAVRVGTLEGILHDVMPIVYTVRTAHQAGTWPDATAEHIEDMLYVLELGLRSGMEVLDIEAAWRPHNRRLVELARKRYPQTVLLGSHHVVGKKSTDEEALQHYHSCHLDDDADAVKVVLSLDDNDKDDVSEEDIHQAQRCGEIATKESGVPFIGLILGEKGQYSRVINRIFTPVTHASLPFVAAPGQLTTEEILQQRTTNHILHPQHFGILGHNIAYSVSPAMHNAAFEALQLPHRYSCWDCEDVGEFLEESLKTSAEWGGASVTIPHKEAVIEAMGGEMELSESVRRIGALNTIIVERDSVTNEVKKYYGDNTDWIGMYLPLSRLLSTNRNQNDKNGIAVILGAGGTAKAAAYTVQQLGLHPIFINERTPARATSLANTFQGSTLSSFINDVTSELTPFISQYGPVQILISTLPAAAGVTMPQWFLDCTSDGLIVLDVNYKPYNTPLLTQAVAIPKVKVIRGSEMLWEQGVQQLERWLGRVAPFGVMREVVLRNCLPDIVADIDEEKV